MTTKHNISLLAMVVDVIIEHPLLLPIKQSMIVEAIPRFCQSRPQFCHFLLKHGIMHLALYDYFLSEQSNHLCPDIAALWFTTQSVSMRSHARPDIIWRMISRFCLDGMAPNQACNEE